MTNHVRFLKDFDYELPGTNGWSTKAYKAGTEATVTRDCAAKAIAAGAAEEIKPPKKTAAHEVTRGKAVDERG